MPVKYEPHEQEKLDLNKLFVAILDCRDEPGCEHADELLNDLHDQVESIANIAFASGLEFLGKMIGEEL